MLYFIVPRKEPSDREESGTSWYKMDRQKTLDVGVSYKSVVNDEKSNRKPFLDVEQQGIFRGHLVGHLYPALFDLSFYKWGN